ncbi:hypothetical protein CLOM_g8527 [Closterium sp. NIES-68]|nr:hypothetical protein CLOM_g8527 [Closterium sp. NIES-68]GJP75064.1 hypothetical protein CLOP_g5562 [Closterium sp. NIES-67]GJP83768.1 hypothetical protein CLOP_g13880 [Closterium sp. NIES-67]
MPSRRDQATPWQRLRSRVFRVQEVHTLFAGSGARDDTWHSPRSPHPRSTRKGRDRRSGEAESAEAAEWGGGSGGEAAEWSGGSGGEATLKRSLGWADTISLGVASIIGAGVFVITGVAARDHAGPAVILSYLLSATSALLSALCYTEFAVHLPVAGGAFSYLMVTLGELPAFITVANLLMEYILSNAAAARGLSAYFAGFLGQDPDFFRLPMPAWGITLDFVALGLIMSLSALVAYGTQESSYFNFLASGLSMVAIVIIIVAGFTAGSIANVTTSFAPFGFQGMLDAAALVYFCFIGFDAVTTLAEEVANPAVDLPVGIVGSVAVVALIYGFMALSLCLLVPYTQIDPDAPFSSALRHLPGWDWAAGAVAAGALLAIVTAVLVGLMGQARIVLVVARAELLPKQLASVSPVTRTPLVATVVLGIATGVIALLVDLETLASMVSIGTLLIFLMVALALLLHRYHPRVLLPAPASHHTRVALPAPPSYHPRAVLPSPPPHTTNPGSVVGGAAADTEADEGAEEPTAADDQAPLVANGFHSQPHDSSPQELLSPRAHKPTAARKQEESGKHVGGKPKEGQGHGQGSGESMGVVLTRLGVMVGGAAGVAVAFRVLQGNTAAVLLSALLWAAATASLARCREAEATRVFSVPFSPWLPALSILVNVLLLASLDASAFIRFIVWSAIVTIGYVLMVLLSREPKGDHGSMALSSARSPARAREIAEAVDMQEEVADSNDMGDVEFTPLVTHPQT